MRFSHVWPISLLLAEEVKDVESKKNEEAQPVQAPVAAYYPLSRDFPGRRVRKTSDACAFCVKVLLCATCSGPAP